MPKKPQELSPIYKEISDFEKVKRRIKVFLLTAENHPDFQEIWERAVKEQFEKGVEKYEKTLDENETKDYGEWFYEGMQEMVDWAAYDVKGQQTLHKAMESDPKLREKALKLRAKLKKKYFKKTK